MLRKSFFFLILQLKLSHQLSGSEPFKIVHSFLNEDPHIKTDVLTVLLLKVTAIGNYKMITVE